MRKLFLIMIMTLLLIPSLGNANVSANGFSDVPPNHRFYEAITFLIEKGVFSQSKQFGVDQKITREEMAILVSKSIGLNGGKSSTPFKDVPSSLEYSGYINSAVKAGIVQGYPDGTFKPKELVNRGQMAIFLAKAFNLKNESRNIFSDVGVNMVAYSSIQKVGYSLITAGYPDNTFRPNDTLTRGQIAAFLARALDPWGGFYFSHGYSGKHSGTDLTIEKLTNDTFNFQLRTWYDIWFDDIIGGGWYGYDEEIFEGVAITSNNTATYNKDECTIKFGNTTRGVQVYVGSGCMENERIHEESWMFYNK